MNPSQRVVLNAAVTYGRSIVAVVLTLFSSRWVLNALGQTDFGLYSVVGAIIVFITILNSVMAGSVARHFAYAIGGGESTEVNRWFNAALCIHLLLAFILVLIGWPAGEYIIVRVLTIPLERMSACLWVFRVSMIAAFFSMVSMPFVAMFTARQRMVEPACWLTGYSLLGFLLAMNLNHVPGDKLIFYAASLTTIVIIFQFAQVARAMTIFDECHIKLQWWRDGSRAKEVFAFAGWNLFGTLGGSIRDQGSAVLLNLHFGPKVNAAYGIANQVSAAASMLTNAVLGALSPEMTSSEGRGDRGRMLALAQRASKIGTILIMLFAVPLIAEMDYVLKLWLSDPPAYSVLFCQLILTSILIDRITAGTMLAISAHGRIAAYQATLGTGIILTLPLAWIFLKLGAPPTGIGAAFIVTAIAVSIGRVLWMRQLLDVPIRNWLVNVLLPCCIVAIVAITAVSIPCRGLASSFTRFALTCASGMITAILTAWFFALNDAERVFIRSNTRQMLSNMANELNR